MIAELTLPRLGETMETGRIAGWLKQPGERFRRGETLLEVESDKTVVEMPALADGTLVEIVAQPGDDVDVGGVLCRYEDGAAAPAAEPVPAPTVVVAPIVAPITEPVVAEGRGRATPLARSVARLAGVAIDDMVGTGPRGRVEARDVRARAAPPVSASDTVTLGGLAYRSWGDPGAGVTVLLHGLAGDGLAWAGLGPVIARAGGRAVAPDLPSHGVTTLDATGIDGLVDAVAGFVEALGVRNVHLVGHSLGGAVAVRVAHRLPTRVEKLTLIAPAGLDREIDAAFVRDIARAGSGGALGHLMRRLSVRPAPVSVAQRDALVAEIARGRLVALADDLADATGQRVDVVPELRSLVCPVRIVWGLTDRIIPWTQAAQAGSRCAIHLVADAGHVPHWDQPAEVTALFA